MRPAGRTHNVIVSATSIRSLSESLSRRADDELNEADRGRKVASSVGVVDTELSDAAETEVILAPVAFAEAHAAAAALERAERHLRLADDIRQRIDKRLPGRIHNLIVRLDGDTVVLEGRCATYYSKQLAQTAALGALEDERLKNSIVVTM